MRLLLPLCGIAMTSKRYKERRPLSLRETKKVGIKLSLTSLIDMKTIGYNHGRFQPLHNGHFNTFLKILEKYDELWIGIANPLRQLPQDFEKLEADLQQSVKRARDPKNNPYTYFERYEMVWNSLQQHGVDMSRVHIAPHFAYYETVNWKDFIPPGGCYRACGERLPSLF